MEQEKVNAIRKWPTPTTKKQLQSFLRFINFYRRFIPRFAHISNPLTYLTGKHPWNWTPECQQAFDILKETLANASDLFLSQDHGKWQLETDASDYALGAILYQYQDYPNHGLIPHPVTYLSKTMLPAERNYPIYDKEMLAIMTALKEWRHFLIGTEESFEIWSDHDNIKHY
ncbi:hypothetical protein AX16_001245, partial [Volvariella volvacea WC 439]